MPRSDAELRAVAVDALADVAGDANHGERVHAASILLQVTGAFEPGLSDEDLSRLAAAVTDRLEPAD